MRLALLVGQRSTCLRRQVGAVIVRDRRIVATGYNGPPSGITHCSETGCARAACKSGEHLDLCRAVHAEVNAILQCAKYGVAIEGADIYSTATPCLGCAKEILNVGIHMVYVNADYPNRDGIEMLKQGGIVPCVVTLSD